MSIGLTSSILTSKVNIGDANKIQTHRIQNPDAMMCPVWGVLIFRDVKFAMIHL